MRFTRAIYQLPALLGGGEFATRCRRPLLAEVSIAGSRRSRRRRLPALVGAGSLPPPGRPVRL